MFCTVPVTAASATATTSEGFAGSDTIVFNGKLKYANFILFYQAEGAEIRTAESLLNGRELNNVQKAMVAAGIVQSAYNAPAAALILTWLLEQKPNPTREEIKDVLTSIFIRDAGYEHYYLAVKLATELLDFRRISQRDRAVLPTQP